MHFTPHKAALVVWDMKLTPRCPLIQGFSTEDFTWVLYEVLEPSKPSGGGGGKSKASVGTGGVMLLIAFFAGVIYLGGGLILNYR